MVATDGAEIDPLEVTSAIIHPGETMDLEVHTNQSEGSYWIRAQTLREGVGGDIIFGEVPNPQVDDKVREVKAILRYQGSNFTKDPTTSAHTCSEKAPCKVFNCPFPAYPHSHNKQCIPISQARAHNADLERHQTEYGLNDTDVTELFFNFGFNWGSSINGKKFVYPSEPFSQSGNSAEWSCDHQECSHPDRGCSCTHKHELPFNRTIQMVLTNFEPEFTGPFPYIGHHPIHMHGHNFALLHVGFPEYLNGTTKFLQHNKDIVCQNRLCKTPKWKDKRPVLNLENPPIKDTILVPARGYVVIRFRSTNPGYWLMHCHANTHHMEGMNMVVKEGAERIPQVPAHFPQCHSFSWSQNETKKHLDVAASLLKQEAPCFGQLGKP